MSWTNTIKHSIPARVASKEHARRLAQIQRAPKATCCWCVTGDDGHMRECGAPAIARHNKNAKLFYCAAHEIKASHRLNVSREVREGGEGKTLEVKS